MQPANYFFNLVNQNQSQASTPAQLNRAGGAFFAGSILISTPRQNDPDSNVQLEVEGNQVVTDFTGSIVEPTAVPPGMTFPLGPGFNGRILSRVEALNLDAAYVVWATTPLISGGNAAATTFNYAIPQFNNSALSGAGAPITLSFANQPAGPILDFTTACANNQIFLFWVDNAAPSAISWTQFNGAGSEASPAEQLVTIVAAKAIISIDAAAVQILGSDGTQSTQIAVVALADVGGLPQFSGWLVDPVSGQFSVIPMPATPPMPDPSNSCIRAAWGTVATDSTPTNGLVLVCIPSQDDANFINSLTFPQDAIGYGSTRMTVLSFPPSAIPAWQDMRPPASNWPLGIDSLPANQAATSAPMTVLFPLPLSNGGDNATVTYYVGLGTSAGVVQMVDNESTFVGEFYYVQFYLAFRLSPSGSPSTPQGTTIEPDFGGGDVAAALSSWTLVGMIAGLPPYFPDQRPRTVSLTHTLASKESTSTTAAFTKTVTVGGGCAPLSGSFSEAITKTNTSTSEFSLENSIEFLNGILPRNEGVALYWQPQYQYQDFAVANAVGTATGLTFHMFWAAKSGGIQPIFFTLTDLNVPVDDNPLNLAFCNFPKADDGISLARFPLSDAPRLWTNSPPLDAWLSETLLTVNFFTVTPNSEIQPADLNFGTDSSKQLTNFSNLELSQDSSKIMDIFGIKSGGKLSFNTTIDSDFGNSQTFTFAYSETPADDDIVSFQVQPLLLVPVADNAPWVPALNATQRPWLLTWMVQQLISDGPPRK